MTINLNKYILSFDLNSSKGDCSIVSGQCRKRLYSHMSSEHILAVPVVLCWQILKLVSVGKELRVSSSRGNKCQLMDPFDGAMTSSRSH